MNRSWLTLIIIGVIVLFVAVGWEIYQNASGNRSNITVTVIEYQRKTLFSPIVEKHLSSDPIYISRNSSQGNQTQTFNGTTNQENLPGQNLNQPAQNSTTNP